MQHLHPLESTRGLDDEVVLAVVDKHVDLCLEQHLDQMHVLVHEIRVQTFVDVAALLSEGDLRVKPVPLLVVGALKESADELVGVLLVLGDIVDVDVAGHVDDEVESEVEAVMELVPLLETVLVGGIQDDVLDGGALLIVDQPQIEGKLPNLRQDVVGMRKTVTNGNALQSS